MDRFFWTSFPASALMLSGEGQFLYKGVLMVRIKFNYPILFFFFLVFFFSACVNSKYRAPDIPEWQICTIKSGEPDSVRISEVNGKCATGRLNGKKTGEFPDTISVPKGQHEILPCYINRYGKVIYGKKIQFYAQQQQEYIIKHKIKWDKSIRFWIENNGIDITTEY